MTDWAFQTWPRIVVGAVSLAVLFGVAHVLAGIVTETGEGADAATGVLVVMCLVGYLAVAVFIRRNPIGDHE